MKFIYEGGTGEIVEKKSRFIATVRKAESEGEALAFISEMKKKYWDARHNCYAYRVGNVQRCSDDGEPGGTAGRPMLEILLREDIHNVVVVVTRYFGGTLLGTGGLIRAYQGALQEGLADSVVAERTEGVLLTVQAAYSDIGKLQHLLAEHQVAVADTRYTDQVEMDVVVSKEQLDPLQKDMMDGTGGNIAFVGKKAVEFGNVGGKTEIFKQFGQV